MHNTRAQAASLQLGNGVNQEHVFVKPALPRRVGLVTPGFNFDPDREPFYLVNPNPNMQNFPHGHQNIQAIQPQQLSLATASTTMTMFRPQESPFAPSSTTTVMVQPQQFPLTTGSATTPIVQPQELPIATSSNSTTMVRGGGGTNTVENSNKRSRTTEEDSPTPSKGSRKSRLQLSASGSKKATSGPPKPYGKPLVWASDRQALCEALPYYRAYQQSGYTTGGLGYGFLLDKDCGARSYMDEEVVITRAGGGCKADDSGVMRQSTDQSIGTSHILSFINNKDRKVAVALIVGSSNENCPVQVPHRYCVMDWFQVTDTWAEKINDKTCFKFRFEKIDLTTKSWWAPEGSPLPLVPRPFSLKADTYECLCCHLSSKQIFEQGWMCLNEVCPKFWTFRGAKAPTDLVYCKKFLEERTPWPAFMKPTFDLKPEPLKDDPSHVNLAVSLAGWKGMVCPRCGRCNSRNVWAEWQCKSKNCDYTHRIRLSPIPASAVLPDHTVEYIGHALPLDRHSTQVILRQPEFLGDWRIHTYDIMEGNTVTHFHANGNINQKPGGAHDIFLALQSADLGLQRFPLRTSPVQGEMLTSHFATNFGMPYKYIVSVNSKPFKDAPEAIMSGLNRLTWAGKHAVGAKEYQNANELLALGYFEKQQIHYHDDGETDLGPTIATLSLGGEAEMTIRMKEKYFSIKRFNFNAQDPNIDVVPGCQMYEERAQLKRAYANQDNEAIEAAMTVLKKGIATEDRARLARPCLTMTLRHGDMVVMHGAGTQKYFEHEVVPKGKLRFALTSRFVDPAKIDKKEHWKGEFAIDPADVYNGDLPPNPVVAENANPFTMEAEVANLDMPGNYMDDGSADRAFLDQWEALSGADNYL